MSRFLTNAASEQFDSEVKHAYQGYRKIGPHVTLRSNVVGLIYHFRLMGKGLANQKSTQADVTPMDITHQKIPVTLQNWNAPEYTDIFDEAEVNFEERLELAMTIAYALGRRLDQLEIDAMAAATLPAGNVIAAATGGNTGMNVTKLRAAKSALDGFEVEYENRAILIEENGMEQLLGSTEVTSADFNTIKALVNGELNTFLGFTFIQIGTRLEGGLPVATNIVSAFAWHKASVGCAIGIDIRTEVNYIPQKTSWLSNGLMKANAVVRDVEGVVEVLYDRTTAVASE